MCRRTSSSAQRGSVLLIVLVTVLFAVVALSLFIEKAGNDLLADARGAQATRLRPDAYSALEVTLAVLNEFMQAQGGALHSPSEGWSDPLGFAGYESPSGRTIDVEFEDESGKLSLPHADANQLTNLFLSWGETQADSEELTDAFLTWMSNNRVPSTPAGMTDYDDAPIPYKAPQRSLRSFEELANINFVREKFYDETGHPNDLWHRFASTFSLYDFRQSNLNSASADTLAALGQTDPTVQQRISDYVHGTGDYKNQGPAFFKSATDATSVLGQQAIPQGVGVQIRALRITVTVHDGSGLFRLSTVVAPPGGAKAVAATEQTSSLTGAGAPAQTASSNTQNSANTTSSTTTPTQTNNPSTTAARINYPFTLLEIHEEIIENAANPASAPPETASSST